MAEDFLDNVLGDEIANVITNFNSSNAMEGKILKTRIVKADFIVKKSANIGGMGIVYFAQRKYSNKIYALKTIRYDIARTDEERRQICKRFQWESNIWITLGKHKNIVQAYWFDYDQFYRPIVVMEYIEGHPIYGVSLQDHLRNRALNLQEAIKIAIEVITGLLYAKALLKQEMNIEFVHRDVTPANILISKDGIAKITDFGLVKTFSDPNLKVSLSTDDGIPPFVSDGGLCGTPAYMPPEVWKGEQQDERTDSYMLGCVLFEMLYQRKVFEHCVLISDWQIAHLHEIPQCPMQDTYIPRPLKALVLRCLEKEKDKRPLLVELREELQKIHEKSFGNRVQTNDNGDELDEWDWTRRGIGFENLGFYHKAVDCHTRAIELCPKKSEFYVNRGTAFNSLKEYDKALQDFNEGLKLNPRNRFLYLNRGISYSNLGLYEEAIHDFNKVIERYPNYDKAYLNRGIVYYKMGWYCLAKRDFDRSIELNPADMAGHFWRGTTCMKIKDYKQALIDLSKVVSTGREFRNSYLKVFNLLLKIGLPVSDIPRLEGIVESLCGEYEAQSLILESFLKAIKMLQRESP